MVTKKSKNQTMALVYFFMGQWITHHNNINLSIKIFNQSAAMMVSNPFA